MATLIETLCSLFLLIGVGLIAAKAKLLPADAVNTLSTLIMSVTLPATILCSLTQATRAVILDGAVVILVGLLVYLAYFLLSAPLAALFRVPCLSRGTWCICATFPNAAFMGYPIILSVLGETAFALAAVMSIAFNITFFTLGVCQILSGQPPRDDRPRTSWRSILVSAVNAATLIGVCLVLFERPIPTFLHTPLNYLSDLTTPLSMLMIGMKLSTSSVKKVIQNRHVLSASLVHLLVFPLLTWAVLRLIPFSGTLIVPVVIMTVAMPPASLCCIMAEQYGGDVELSVEIVFLSNLLCILTIPLISLLLLS